MTDRIRRILDLAEKATRGPWREVGGLDPIHDDEYVMGSLESSAGTMMLVCSQEAASTRLVSGVEKDAAFIAAARTEVPWLAETLTDALRLLEYIDDVLPEGGRSEELVRAFLARVRREVTNG